MFKALMFALMALFGASAYAAQPSPTPDRHDAHATLTNAGCHDNALTPAEVVQTKAANASTESAPVITTTSEPAGLLRISTPNDSTMTTSERDEPETVLLKASLASISTYQKSGRFSFLPLDVGRV